MHVNGGDGFKNYFTPAYLYKWGDGVWHEAMHYPYGEYALYADAQIGLVYILRLLRLIGLDSEHHLLLVIQGLPLLGFALAAYYVMRLSDHFRLPFWWSFFLALSAVAFSPQIYRMTGHFGLSYAFIVPAYWWYLIRSADWPWYRTAITGGLGILIAGYLHPYWILILVLFTLAYAFFQLVQEKRLLVVATATALAALALFMMANGWIDTVHDRPSNPYGMYAYATQGRSLVSHYGFIHLMIEPLLSRRMPDFEGYAYIGPLLYMMVIGVIAVVISRAEWRTLIPNLGLPRQLVVAFWAAFLLLLFAMGAHLMIGDGVVVEWLTPLKQFRSLGRFAWVYYYVGVVWAGAVTYHLIQAVPSRVWRALLYVTAIVLCYAESHQWHRHIYKQSSQYATEIDWLKTQTVLADLLADSGRSVDRYQALVTLPFSVEGCETISVPEPWSMRKHVFPFVYQTGLPTTMTVMSRTSLSQSLKILQLGGTAFRRKDWITDLPSSKPLLLAVMDVDVGTYSDLLPRAEHLGTREGIHLYEITIDALGEQQRLSGDSLEITTTTAMPQLADNGMIYYDDCNRYSAQGLLGTGGWLMETSHQVVMEAPVKVESDTNITLSFWAKLQPSDPGLLTYKVRAIDVNGSTQWEHHNRHTLDHRFDIIDSWVRYVDVGPVNKHTRQIVLEILGPQMTIDQIVCSIGRVTEAVSVADGYVLIGHDLVETY